MAAHEWRIRQPSLIAGAEIVELLRRRQVWRDVPASAAHIVPKCSEALGLLGVDAALLDELAGAGTIEVSCRRFDEASAAFPWEFVLTEATRQQRRAGGTFRSLMVVRHLDAPTPARRQPSSVSVVESAPGALGRKYSFESETLVVASSLEGRPLARLVNPSFDELRDGMEKSAPDIVHFTGIDAQQGAELLYLPEPANLRGVYLQRDGVPQVVGHDEVAGALTAGGAKPVLVALNFYNSAALARLVVLSGAAAAIGLQDDIDDALAELFFASFYAEWRRNGWQLLEAYRQAWLGLSPHGARLRGTGIVLWSSASLLAPTTIAEPIPDDLPQQGQATGGGRRRRGPEGMRVTRGPTEASQVERPAGPVAQAAAAAPPQPVMVDYEPPLRLNYSLLHNNRGLFPKFLIRRQEPGTHRVSVEIALQAGLETARYQASYALDDTRPLVDVNELARVSLTSELARSLAESVYTSLYVHVRSGDTTLSQETCRVELLPIDEWKDDDENRHWLPSFVLPRDPVVRKIVDTAQSYLVALADDSGAGFDGFQSYDPEGRSLDEKCRSIDNQVLALWWALINDFALSYINPPPTFSDQSQRLRTPSDVIAGRRGTCIDLTLLFAACLEYVEIHPVIFLLTDHAFPGYCRSEQSHDLIREQMLATPATSSETSRSVNGLEQQAWMLNDACHGNVLRLVQAGHIVPLETVALTQRAGFWPSVDEGVQNLRSRSQFQSMFDVRLAREKKVTPLPIGGVRP